MIDAKLPSPADPVPPHRTNQRNDQLNFYSEKALPSSLSFGYLLPYPDH